MRVAHLVSITEIASPEEETIIPAVTSSSRVVRATIGQTTAIVHWTGWILFTGIGAVAVAGLVTMGVMPQDEGELLTYPWLILHGSLPYRDIYMQYPPSTFVLLAALLKVGLPGLLAERGLSVAARLLYLLLINRSLTGSWLRFSWLGVPVAFGLLFFSPDADIRAYPWVIGLPFLWLSLIALRRHPILSAALFFLSATFRFEFGIAGLIALSVLYWRDHTNRRIQVTGLVMLSGLLVAFFVALAALTSGAAIHDVFLDPAFVVSPGRRLPLWPPGYGISGIPLVLIMLAGPTILAIHGWVSARHYQTATNLAIWSLVPHFLQRADWLGLRVVAVATVPWLIVSVRDLLEDRRSHPASGPGRTDFGARAGICALGVVGLTVGAWYSFLVFAFAWLVAPQTLNGVSHRMVQLGQRSIIAWNKGEASDDLQVVRYIRARAGERDRVFIAPMKVRYAMYNMTSLYYEIGLTPASRYLEMDPGLETQSLVQRQIIADLRHARWVILWRGGFWYEPNASQIPGSPLLARFIHSQYHPVFTRPSFQVLERGAPAGPVRDVRSVSVSPRAVGRV